MEQAASSTGHRRRAVAPCGRLWTTVAASPTGADLRRRAGSSPIHSALLPLSAVLTTQRGEGSRREVPMRTGRARRSPGVAGRAATTPQRSAARATCVCSCTGDQLAVTGTDLELTIHVEVTVAGDTDGVLVLPARLTTDIVRALRAGRGRRGRRGRRGPHQLRPFAVHRAHRAAGRLPAPAPSRRTDGVTPARRRCFGDARAPGGAGGQPRGEPAGAHRRAAGRRGGGPAAGRHRLVPAGHARPARHVGARDRPAGARAVAGPQRARPGAATVERGHGAASASATRPSTPARCS